MCSVKMTIDPWSEHLVPAIRAALETALSVDEVLLELSTLKHTCQWRLSEDISDGSAYLAPPSEARVSVTEESTGGVFSQGVPISVAHELIHAAIKEIRTE